MKHQIIDPNTMDTKICSWCIDEGLVMPAETLVATKYGPQALCKTHTDEAPQESKP